MTERTPDPDPTRTAEHRILPAGRVLAGRYELIELIGMGGMGMVYRARDNRLNLDVALKVLNPDRASDEQTVARFERELVLARQVSHPNVVRIHDIGQDGDVHFLTMDYVPGRSLTDILNEQGTLTQDQALGIAIDLANALQAAHDKGVVHRDLKPANVLVDDSDRASVTDFGVARSMTMPGATRTGHVLGTPHYLSPEQALGEKVDGRSDIYALGLLLFEMLTGKLPFASDSYDEILAQRIAGRPNLNALDANAPEWLRAVVARCLSRHPDDRYPDAESLIHDLEHQRVTRAHWRPGKSTVYAVVAMLFVGVLAAGAWFFILPETASRPAITGVSETAQPATALHTVAVVPFADQTGQARLDWISTGAAEMLAVQLAESPALQVVDTLRVFRTVDDLNLGSGFLGEVETRQLSELLDTDRLITGRIRFLGPALRIEARLIGAGMDDNYLQNFQVTAAGAEQLLAAISELANELRNALQAKPGATHERLLSASPQAMAAYTDGVFQLSQGNTLAAVEQLEEAIAIDPEFSAAWVRLADAYRGLGMSDQARQAVDQAVSGLNQPGGRVAMQAQAMRAAIGSDMETALDLRRKLVSRFPHDIEARVALGGLLGNMGHLDQAREVLKGVVASDPQHPRAWYLLGKFAILGGDSRAAIDEYLVRALVIQNKLDNPQGKADVLNAMGIAYAQLGELEEAQNYYRQAADMRREIGDRRGVAAALSNMAHLHMLQGEYDEAQDRLEEALVIQTGLGDREGIAYIHNELGVLTEEQGQYDEALSHFRDALKVRQDLGNQRALAESFNNVGYAYYLLGEYDNAAIYAGQALDLYQSINVDEGAMQARHTIGLIEIARGNWEEALEAGLAALETSRTLQYPIASAVALGILGKVAYYQGRYQAALESYREAFQIVKKIDDPRGMSEFALNLANTYLALGALAEAADMLEQTETWLNQGGNREQRADLLRLRGELLLKRDRADEALALLKQAVTKAKTSGSVISLLEARLALARAYLARNESDLALDQAEAVVESAGETGHVALHLQALATIARAQMGLGHITDAGTSLAQAISLARAHEPYGQAWRLHWLKTRLAQGEEGSTKASLSAAREALARVRKHVPEDYLNGFNQQTWVRELDAQDPQIATN